MADAGARCLPEREDRRLGVPRLVRGDADARARGADAARRRRVERLRLDLAWVERLRHLAELGRRVALALGVLFGFGVLLVVGNTIRLAVESRRREIEVVMAVPVIAHRMVMDPQARFSGVTARGVVEELLKKLKVPA